MFQGLEEIPCRSVGYVLRILGQNPTEDEIVEMVMKVSKDMMVIEVSKDMMVIKVCKDIMVMEMSKDMMVMKVCKDMMVIKIRKDIMVMEVSKASGIDAGVAYLHTANSQGSF